MYIKFHYLCATYLLYNTRVKTTFPFIIILLTMLTACCKTKTEYNSLLPDSVTLQEGDVVMRRCTSLSSRMVTWTDTDGAFSHTGIVVDSAGIPMIVHAVPDEPDYAGDPDRVKMDTPARFFSSAHAIAAAVLRHPDAEVAASAARCAADKYRQHVLFDHHFDDEDTTELYCTELIVHAYRHAGVELVDSQRHVVDLPGIYYRCILPSQLEHSTQLQTIFMFHS